MYCKLKICQENGSHIKHSFHNTVTFKFLKKDTTGMEMDCI